MVHILARVGLRKCPCAPNLCTAAVLAPGWCVRFGALGRLLPRCRRTCCCSFLHLHLRLRRSVSLPAFCVQSLGHVIRMQPLCFLIVIAASRPFVTASLLCHVGVGKQSCACGVATCDRWCASRVVRRLSNHTS